VKLEITPEPNVEERAAILAALAQEVQAAKDAETEAETPQEFLMKGEDSVRP